MTGTTPGRRGRFEGYDVLGQALTWDPVTAGVVLARLEPARELRFFTRREAGTARALVDRLLAQDDEPHIPVLELLDARLAANETDGWRYADMPEDGAAWRRSLRHLDEDAEGQHGRRFCALDRRGQQDLLEGVRTAEVWHDLPAERVWSLWLRYVCAAFYSHPWAWNEIGFGGPAYPRGYANIGLDRREHWERPESPAPDPVPWASRLEGASRRHAGDGELASPTQPAGSG